MEASTNLDQLVAKIQAKLNAALESLTRKPVNLVLKTSGLIPIMTAQKLLENAPGSVTAVYIPIVGEVNGDIFVFLPSDLANGML
ncbi:MAG: hypothetical protein UT66_C0001G0038 [candidate division CPR2 bacterium GW2011_GWC1_39_9]|nr:MAG: hypothetical protein UT66_C0001G0038 [candidate division CPR2 bacterium GW2011_GWC1_39_9]